jgi:hypothetical protein
LFSKLGSKLVLVGRDEKALDETIKSCENQDVILKDIILGFKLNIKTEISIQILRSLKLSVI